jgi:hypothetical protein
LANDRFWPNWSSSPLVLVSPWPLITGTRPAKSWSPSANIFWALQLIAIANGSSPPPDRELAINLVRATYLDLPRLTTITFEELVSTGSLRILQNTQFKRALAESLQVFRHQSQWYDNYRRIEYNTENVLRGLAPIEVRTEGFDAVERPEVMARFDSEAVVRAIRNTKDIVPILEDSVWTQARAFRTADILLQNIAALQAMLIEMGID